VGCEAGIEPGGQAAQAGGQLVAGGSGGAADAAGRARQLGGELGLSGARQMIALLLDEHDLDDERIHVFDSSNQLQDF
jgi:hypothetical protein